MQLVRFAPHGADPDPYHPDAGFGVLSGDAIHPTALSFAALADALTAGGALPLEGEPIPTSDVRLLPPSAPTKIVCIGLNYRHHAEEVGKAIPEQPLMFLKPPSALLAPGEPIVLPESSSLVHHEGELAVVIGRRARRVSESEAMGYVLGLTCMNDVTARDIQRREKRYTRGKGFDTFAPCGPALLCGADPSALHVTCSVNGEVRQTSPTSDMIFSIPTIIAFVSAVMTLMPGDIITTGTPSGVGPLNAGDEVRVEIPGIGVLRSPVV